MKNTNWLVLIVATLVSAALRIWQNISGFDEAGLSVGGVCSLLLPALLAVVAVYFVWDARRLPPRSEHSADFAESHDFSAAAPLIPVVAGSFLVLLSAVAQMAGGKSQRFPLLALGGLRLPLAAVPAALGGLCALYAVLCLRRGTELSGPVLLGPVCCLLVYVVFLYRADAADPVLAHIYVEILASAALTLAWLERSAFAFRNGAPRLYLPLSELAALLSLTAAVDLRSLPSALLYAGCALGELGFLLAWKTPEQ